MMTKKNWLDYAAKYRDLRPTFVANVQGTNTLLAQTIANLNDIIAVYTQETDDKNRKELQKMIHGIHQEVALLRKALAKAYSQLNEFDRVSDHYYQEYTIPRRNRRHSRDERITNDTPIF